jgi:hypothetical protein
MMMNASLVEKVGITSCMPKQQVVIAIAIVISHHAVSGKLWPMSMQNEERSSILMPKKGQDFASRVLTGCSNEAIFVVTVL